MALPNTLSDYTIVKLRLIVFSCLFFTIAGVETNAQSSEPKIDVIGQFTFLRASEFASGTTRDWEPGGGGIFTYNLNKHVGIEAAFFGFGQGTPVLFGELEFLPEPEVQGLFGIKAGSRNDRYGVFAKVRPGFTRLSKAQDCDGEAFTSCAGKNKSAFTVDYGGVFEIYPQRRIVVRVDAGWAYMSYPERRVFIPSEPGSAIPSPGIFVIRDGVSKNHFQISVGAGFRF